MPWRWETSKIPMLGKYPQAFTSEQGIDKADILIAISGSRLGTPTPDSISGTAEEINPAIKGDKPVHLYSSNAPHPNDVDVDHLRAFRTLRNEFQQRGLAATFADIGQLVHIISQAIEHDVSRLIERRQNNADPTKRGARFRVPSKEIRASGHTGRNRPMKSRVLKGALASLAMLMVSTLGAAPSFADSNVGRDLKYVGENTYAHASALPEHSIPCTPRGSLTPTNVQVIHSTEIVPMCAGSRIPATIAGFRVSTHAATRMADRYISTSQVHATLTIGRKYYDPEYRNHPYYRRNVVVATGGNTILTVYISPSGLPRRFQPIVH